ncbi:G patch domain and ankyrin repeat-containing protein 1 homolog isoform X1 [Bacillus rossius redtenbacheri]|uniref:G patch domain and ankyrin repeat-containing protein 1 homolog isoform X1 n=1 Tax=Bacillus rossius redtenbacheri TaxID=93214 RepID=UPI002FDEEA5E
MELHPNWNALATVDFRWKRFIKEGCNENRGNACEASGTVPVDQLTGQEARATYEEVIKEPVNNVRVRKHFEYPASIIKENNRLPFRHADRQLWKTRVMKFAELNDVKGLQAMLADFNDVNFTDSFGWTPLMCAACAGSVDTVQFLIESGADVKVKDKCGNTCLSLAKKKNHTSVVEAIVSKTPKRTKVVKDCKEIELNEEFYCELCKQTFHETSRQKHSSSTVHLLNSQPPLASKTVYGIPESNRGYQILLKGGWDRERGLGPNGTGHKYPLKTVLKQDREGLGARVVRPKVTHFQPRDTAAVRVESQKKVKKRHRETDFRREQHKERQFRREFYSSL